MNSSTIKSIKLLTAGTGLFGLLIGCSSSTDYDFEASQLQQRQQVKLSAIFDPSNGQLPFPNDLLFSGSQDGTLNIPVAPIEDPTADPFSDPRAALNTLDGFSTIEPAVVSFAQTPEFTVSSIDAESVILGETARIFEVTRDPATGAVTGVVEELLDENTIRATVIPTDPTTSPNGTSIAFAPVRPLKESTTYMAMVTNGVKNNLGTNLERGTVFGVLAGDDPQDSEQATALQGLINAMLTAGDAAGVPEESVIIAWSFTTQSISPVIQTLKEAAVSTPITIDTPLGGTGALSEESPDQANIFAGRMTVPYYLDMPTAENPVAPLRSFFKTATGDFLSPLDNIPNSSTSVTIPVLMTVPKGTPEAGGWPIAIYQHGITRSRADMLALADAMAFAGFAMIAIDLPVHGILPTDDAALFSQPDIERHFNMDLVNNETGAPGPDENIDGSGRHYYNLANLLNTRDNTRQAVADLFSLSASLGSLDNINPARQVFVGHSLGAIVGTTFLAYADETITNASLASGSGGLSRLLAASPAFGPAIAAGLASENIDVDGPSGNEFLNAAQTVIDSSDPINHATRLAARNSVIHMTQINGDTVVINNLPGFPLVGTEALARILDLENVTETTVGGGFVKFEPGYHSSLLSPAVDENNSLVSITAEQAAAVFTELQKQVAQFSATGTIVIDDTSVLAMP